MATDGGGVLPESPEETLEGLNLAGPRVGPLYNSIRQIASSYLLSRG